MYLLFQFCYNQRCWYFHRVRIILITFFGCITVCGLAQSLKSTLDKGDKLFAKADYKGALVIYQSAEKTAPNDPNVKYRIGQCYLSTGHEVKALPYLEDAYALKSDVDPDVDYFLGIALQANFHFYKAIDHFKKYKTKNKK